MNNKQQHAQWSKANCVLADKSVTKSAQISLLHSHNLSNMLSVSMKDKESYTVCKTKDEP